MSSVSQDDIDLNNYEEVRKRVVNSITSKGIPTDNETLSILLKAIDGGSNVILKKKRIEADKEDNNLKTQQQAILMELLKNTPTARQNLERTKELPSIEAVVPLPGETSIGTKELSYEEIMSNGDQTHQKQ